VYVRESEELMDEVKRVASDAINSYLDRAKSVDPLKLKTTVKDDLTKFLYAKTKRKPMILPVIMDI
jgi:ribonuclease J